MSRPLFSCVVPVKGERPYFDAAMASLYAQNMGDDLEIIVQDADVEPDEGQSDALNKGFAKARGEWLFWLNADDILLPGALQKVKAAILSRTPNSDFLSWISGNVVYLNEGGNVLRCSWNRGWKWPTRGLPVRVGGPSSFFRRELLKEVGGFDTSLKYAMDTDLWGRFRTAGYWPLKMPFYVWGFRDWNGSLTSGDLHGRAPSGMNEEHRILDARHGVSHWRLRFAFLRLVRLLNGSLIKALMDSCRFSRKNWKEVRS